MNSIEDFRDFTDTTEYLLVTENLYEKMSDDFCAFIGNNSVFLIADENTMTAAGHGFVSFCKNNGISLDKPLIFPSEPELTSDYAYIEEIKNSISITTSVPIALGSGTINDLVKRASHELGRPYGVIATAASVDGYASDGAAIVYKGLKQTLPCSAPAFIAADKDVLKNAPSEMTAAGYADLLAKNPAGADWIMADMVGLDKINKHIWAMIQGNLADWTSDPQNLEKVFTGLNVAGFAMQHMKRSRPVSGAEHLLSHIWEMNGHTFEGSHISHGFKVAIGSLASIALMETIFTMDFDKKNIAEALDVWPDKKSRLESVSSAFSGSKALEDLLKINDVKHSDKNTLEKRLTYLSAHWRELKQKMNSQLISYRRYKEMLSEAQCPVRAVDIGLSVEKVLMTYYPAQMMRNRYTILDLAFETGLLDRAVKNIKSSCYYLK